MNPVSWFNVTDLTAGIYANPRSPLIDGMPVYLDYFLFLALLGWTLVLLVWWWHPRRVEAVAWNWVPWAAAIGVLNMLVEFLSLQLAVFGNARNYSLPVDIVQCGLWLLVAGAWGWTSPWLARRPGGNLSRGLFVMSLVVAVVLRRDHPLPVAWFMVGSILLAGAPWLWARGATLRSRSALVFFILGSAVSTTGPFAHLSFTERRSSVPSLLEPWAVGWLGLAALLTLVGLLRHALNRLSPDERRELRGAVRPFAARALAVVVLGVAAALVLGEAEYSRTIERSLEQVREVRAQVDTANLARLLDDRFHVERLEPGLLRAWLPATLVRSARLDSPEAAVLRGTLDSLVLAAATDIQEVRFVTLRGGHLIAFCGKIKTPGTPGRPPVVVQLPPAFLGRAATAEDRQAWRDRAEVYERSAVFGSSGFTSSRIPLTAPDGRMLGWLEFLWPYQTQMVAAQKVRAVPFVATVLGVALVALFFVQAQHACARERALRRAAIETESNRMKTAFLASVSHELRTPLQNILGRGELLQPEIESDAGRAHLAALRSQGELMVRLVNDLIDLSAVEAGSFRLIEQPCSPAEIVRQTVESLRPHAEAKGLQLFNASPAMVAPSLALDEGRLRQVLTNLIANAIKFTDAGSVTVALRLEPESAAWWRGAIEVRDTGPGISPADQPRLFTAFTRLPNTAAKEGSGLGLALSAALCRAMGGEINVESDGVTGSCFTASFRAATAPVPASPAPAARMARTTAPRVLVVDDNPLVRELFMSFLTEKGARCTAAGTGTEALARAGKDKLDAIVLDLALPDGDGTEFVGPLRQLVPGVAIIGVSAHAAAADRQRALAAGMDIFLLKPVPLAELWAAVTGSPPAPAALWRIPDELRVRLRRDFQQELPARRAELAVAVQAADWRQVRAAAHYLRNSALILHAEALRDASAGLEAAAVENPREAPVWWTRCAVAMDNLAADSA